jgi:hypothetical protein
MASGHPWTARAVSSTPQRWWGAGIDAGKPDQLVSAIKAGFNLKDLDQVVHGRTIAEYLQAGYSIAWVHGSTPLAAPGMTRSKFQSRNGRHEHGSYQRR